ncbi:MAG: NUDIX hydrolase [Clostridia bacterium]
MLVRHCAGGVVFHGDTVFLLKNEKEEWVLPKGVVRGNARMQEVALARVEAEAGVKAQILLSAGETNYEFYSITRRTPVCNHVLWFIMEAERESFCIAFEQGFLDGGYYPMEQALEMITYTQDRSLVRLAYEKYHAWKKPVQEEA